MKTNKLYILIALLCLAGMARSQSTPKSELVIIKSVTDVKDNSLYVNVDLDLGKIRIPMQDALILTPVIQTPEGRSQSLPAVFVGGRTKFKAYRRAEAFGAPQIAFVSMKVRKDETSVINYSYVLPYDSWMKDAQLLLKVEVYGCASCQKSMEWLTLVDRITPPEPIPLLVNYVTPPVEKVKARNAQGKAYLDFPVGKSVILPDFRNNPSELNKINEIVTKVNDNKYATITSIDLTGYASPEGPATLNENLSKDRAFALKNYLQDKYGYKNDLFNVQWRGEDWEGLKALVDKSDLKDKYLLLDIIASSATDAVKDRKVKSLSGGATYRTLLNEYYPLLRRVEYRLNYTIRAFSVTEGVAILKTAPAEMSLNEMFLVANTYPKGSNEFNEVFDVAVRIYPSDPIANINAGAMALEKGDLATAHRYLDKLADVPQAWNNIGVMYLMEKDYAKAEVFLNKAKSINSPEAVQNLERLKEEMQ